MTCRCIRSMCYEKIHHCKYDLMTCKQKESRRSDQQFIYSLKLSVYEYILRFYNSPQHMRELELLKNYLTSLVCILLIFRNILGQQIWKIIYINRTIILLSLFLLDKFQLNFLIQKYLNFRTLFIEWIKIYTDSS